MGCGKLNDLPASAYVNIKAIYEVNLIQLKYTSKGIRLCLEGFFLYMLSSLESSLTQTLNEKSVFFGGGGRGEYHFQC
jgi:hypothetical protein